MFREKNKIYNNNEIKERKLKKNKIIERIRIINENILKIRRKYVLSKSEEILMNNLIKEKKELECKLINYDFHHKSLKFKTKKRSLKQVKLIVEKELREIYLKDRFIFSAEEIAIKNKLDLNLVRQSLHLLNLEGIVSQKKNEYLHDSSRNPWCDGPSGWKPSMYTILKIN